MVPVFTFEYPASSSRPDSRSESWTFIDSRYIAWHMDTGIHHLKRGGLENAKDIDAVTRFSLAHVHYDV